MKFPFARLALVSVLVISSISSFSHAQAKAKPSAKDQGMTVSEPATQDQPDKSYSQISQSLRILKSGRSYKLLLKLQQQINALGDTDKATSDSVTEIRNNLQTLTNDLITEADKIETAVDALSTAVATNGTKIDKVSDEVSEVGVKVDNVSAQAAQNESSRERDLIESELRTGKFEVAAFVPGVNGKLDLVRDIVSSDASQVEAKGWRNEEAKFYLSKANEYYSKQNYGKALSNYRKAYMQIEGELRHNFAPFSWYRSTFH